MKPKKNKTKIRLLLRFIGLVQQLFRARHAVEALPGGEVKIASGATQYSTTEIVKAVKPSVVSVSTKISGMANYWGAFSVPYESLISDLKFLFGASCVVSFNIL